MRLNLSRTAYFITQPDTRYIKFKALYKHGRIKMKIVESLEKHSLLLHILPVTEVVTRHFDYLFFLLQIKKADLY